MGILISNLREELWKLKLFRIEAERKNLGAKKIMHFSSFQAKIRNISFENNRSKTF